MLKLVETKGTLIFWDRQGIWRVVVLLARVYFMNFTWHIQWYNLSQLVLVGSDKISCSRIQGSGGVG